MLMRTRVLDDVIFSHEKLKSHYSTVSVTTLEMTFLPFFLCLLFFSLFLCLSFPLSLCLYLSLPLPIPLSLSLFISFSFVSSFSMSISISSSPYSYSSFSSSSSLSLHSQILFSLFLLFLIYFNSIYHFFLSRTISVQARSCSSSRLSCWFSSRKGKRLCLLHSTIHI